MHTLTKPTSTPGTITTLGPAASLFSKFPASWAPSPLRQCCSLRGLKAPFRRTAHWERGVRASGTPRRE
jgi:hypothetical protein